MLFALDAGHGGEDPGATANGLLEKEMTLQLALKTGEYLTTHYHCEVLYTRTRDVFLTLLERAILANKAKADFFCSFHINSFNATARGFETYRYPGTRGTTLALQTAVHEEVMKVLRPYNIVDRGLKEQNYAVVRETAMPALLTETLFISNPNEAKLLSSETFLNEVARAHAVGLAKAAGLEGKHLENNSENKHYLVTGAFKNKETADQYAQVLKSKYGWTVYVKEA